MEDYQANRLQAGQGRMHGEGGQARGRTSILIPDILTANEMCSKPGTCDFMVVPPTCVRIITGHDMEPCEYWLPGLTE